MLEFGSSSMGECPGVAYVGIWDKADMRSHSAMFADVIGATDYQGQRRFAL
jgi:hypothetical protein